MQDEREREIELSQWLTEMGVDVWNREISDFQSLDIRGYPINSLPDSIVQLTNLHTLKLINNRLTSLPRSIAQLTNLQTLIIVRNKLVSLPDSILELHKLYELDLGFNQLSNLPGSIARLNNLHKLSLSNNQLVSLPDSIEKLTSLRELDMRCNQLSSLPESVGNLSNLQSLNIHNLQLTSLPESIGKLTNLQHLYIGNNHLHSLPKSINRLINLLYIDLSNNPLTDLSPLSALTQENLSVEFLDVALPRRYWTKFSDWQPEWLLDEDNAEIRRALIQQIGYEKICDRLGAEAIDNWREYILLKINRIQPMFDRDNDEPIDWEPLVMLKMTCPSTGHIHILRVPPEITSAEAAITWVNHGIHPDEIAVQT